MLMMAVNLKKKFSTNHCLNYVKKERNAGDEILFTVNIPNQHLKSWYDLKEDGQDCTRRGCGEVKNKFRQLQGRTRQTGFSICYLQRLRRIAIRQEELINVGLIEEQIKKIRGNAKLLLYEVSKLMWNSEPPVSYLRENQIVRISHMFCLSPLSYSFYV